MESDSTDLNVNESMELDMDIKLFNHVERSPSTSSSGISTASSSRSASDPSSVESESGVYHASTFGNSYSRDNMLSITVSAASRHHEEDYEMSDNGDNLYYACSKCGRTFTSTDLVFEHLKEFHDIAISDHLKKTGDASFIVIGKKSLELDLTDNMFERHLSILKSKIHGRGLFTGNFIHKGEMVVEYFGEIISRTAALRRQHYYDQLKTEHYIMRVGRFVIDATVRGNCSKFINNSCEPNCTAEIIELPTSQRVFFVALRNILAGEEITYDYEFNSDELIVCKCGSKNCRRFLNHNLQKRLNLNSEEIESLVKSLRN